jgi:(S)-ureidoglycine aminohydrolase
LRGNEEGEIAQRGILAEVALRPILVRSILRELKMLLAGENRQTRTRHSRYYFLHTPDAFVRSPLPGLRNATAIIHITRDAGAQFKQFTVEFHQGGSLDFNAGQHFLYVLEGEIEIEEHVLHVGEYAYIPGDKEVRALATLKARATVIEIPLLHSRVDTQVGKLFVGRESSIEPTSMLGDLVVQVRALIANTQTLDFIVNTVTYQPGTTSPRVEVHAAERSVLILSGGGIVRLGEDWYRVTAGDFMWIGPGCPEWFGALGNIPTTRLVYQHGDHNIMRAKAALPI